MDVIEGEMGRACSTNWGAEECRQNIGGKPEGKRPLGIPRRRWLDNTKMDLRDRMGWYVLDSSGSG
jgi:hypothetical protein